MISVRKSSDRGHADHGWLNAYHTFSFASYMDHDHMGFGPLRVLNEDRVAPGSGFPPHPHRDMEILTWVLEGALAHKDSTGASGVLKPGEMQHISAGRGIQHSEFNASSNESVHLLQIWLYPRARGLEPAYAHQAFPDSDRKNKLQVLASPDGNKGGLAIRTETTLYASDLSAGGDTSLQLVPNEAGWLQVTKGSVTVNGVELTAGDGLSAQQVTKLEIKSLEGGSFLLFVFPDSLPAED